MNLIVVPCYNEATRFSLEYWREILKETQNCKWIFVNDGSTDKTLDILKSLRSEKVNVVSYLKNRGKGEAIRFGLNMARVDNSLALINAVGYLDADGAFHKYDIINLLGIADHKFSEDHEIDVLIGSRVRLAGRDINRDPVRHYIGRLVSTFVSNGWEDAPYDSQSGFKLFRVNENLWRSTQDPFKTSWFFDIELIIRQSVTKPIKIWEEPLTQWKEITGGSIKFSKAGNIMKEIYETRRLVRKHIQGMAT